VLLAACLVSGLLLAGCGDAPPSVEPEASPQPTAPDAAALEIAVNRDYEAQASGSGSGLIVPASCVAGVVWNGTFYEIGADGLDGVLDPQPADPLEGAVLPGCNDTGGTSEPDLPISAWAIDGVDTSQAIFVEYP
jgi:hypothetical protein